MAVLSLDCVMIVSLPAYRETVLDCFRLKVNMLVQFLECYENRRQPLIASRVQPLRTSG